MNDIKYTLTREEKCLEARSLIYLLRTRLLEIDVPEKLDKYNDILSELLKKVYEIYWDL